MFMSDIRQHLNFTQLLIKARRLTLRIIKLMVGLQVAALSDSGSGKVLRLGMERVVRKSRLMLSIGDRPMEGLPGRDRVNILGYLTYQLERARDGREGKTLVNFKTIEVFRLKFSNLIVLQEGQVLMEKILDYLDNQISVIR